MQSVFALISNHAYLELSAGAILLLAVSAFATACFHTIGGFGGVLMLSICVAPILGVKTAIPVVAVAGMISNVTRASLFRKHISVSVAFAVLIAAIPGIIVGAWAYSRMSSQVVAAVLGVFLLASVPLRRDFARREIGVSAPGLSAAGAVFGIAGGFVVGAGLILAPFLLGAGLIGESLVGTVAIIGFTLNLTKAAVFSSTTVLTPALTALGIAIGLVSIPGVWCGRWILINTSIRLHTLLVEALIIAGGLYFLWQAL